MTTCIQYHDVISQYETSPKLRAYIKTFLDMADSLIDDLTYLSNALGIDCVTGKALELIGEIVGVQRPWYSPEVIEWFGTEDDGADVFQKGLGVGILWDGSSALDGVYSPVDDVTYRLFINARIIKNQSTGTLEDMNRAIELLTSRTDIRVEGANGEVGVMNIRLVGTQGPISNVHKMFIHNYDILPVPAGVRIVEII